jgi:hypothetical protein
VSVYICMYVHTHIYREGGGGPKLLVYGALSYECMRPSATSVGTSICVHEALRSQCVRPALSY